MILILYKLLLVLSVVLSACGGGRASDAAPLRVVATTGIVADVVRNVADAGASVDVVIPEGADPHEFRASARQARAIAEADLVVAIGFEEGLLPVLEAARGDGVPVLALGPRLDPLPVTAGGGPDPHVWFDPLRMADAARIVAAELGALRPDGDWSAAADAYAAELTAAHEQITEILAPVPEERRHLVTNHDALGYFARRYGFDIAAVVIPGGSTQAEPSPATLAEVVEAIRTLQIPAIFVETSHPGRLAEAVASEVGFPVEVVELYTGSLGPPGSGAETLVGLLLEDARRIAAALAP